MMASATLISDAKVVASTSSLDTSLLFASTSGTFLYKVARGKRTLDVRGIFKLVDAGDGLIASVGPTSWSLSPFKHSMKSSSSSNEPTYTFSSVDDADPESFFCVIFKADTAPAELSLLDQILSTCSRFHVSDRKPDPAAAPQLPKFELPNVDPNMMKEIMRKGAEDTSMMFRLAGDAAQQLMKGAVEMHKKCAPAPAAQPLEVSQELKDKLAQSKVAAKAGATLAKGVASGVVAATDEVTSAIAEVVVAARADNANKKTGAIEADEGQPAEGGAQNKPDVAMLGDLGKNMIQNVEAVRAAMFQAAEVAWAATKSATAEVFTYQYGQDAGVAAKDALEVVEGVTRVTTAMNEVGMHRVALSAAKKTAAAIAESEKDPNKAAVSVASQPAYPWEQLQHAKAASG